MILYLMTVPDWSSEAGMFSRRLESPAEKISIWEDRGRRARLLIRMKISEIVTTMARERSIKQKAESRSGNVTSANHNN